MERDFTVTVSDGNLIKMPVEITKTLGTELQSVCINDVWLIITNVNDSRFVGEALQYSGTAYRLPDSQMAAMGMAPGETVTFVLSDMLNTVIAKKINTKCRYGHRNR